VILRQACPIVQPDAGWFAAGERGKLPGPLPVQYETSFMASSPKSRWPRARYWLKALGFIRLSRAEYVARHPLEFLRRVAAGVRQHQVFLLAGAVAYYTLLALIPMVALILLVLSQFVSPDQLLAVTRETLQVVAPGVADTLTTAIRAFIGNWPVIGAVGVLTLVFFSSLAFTSLENAMSVIFFHRVRIHRRHFLVSAIIPYLYITILAVGLLAVSALSSALHALDGRTVTVFSSEWSLTGATPWVMYFTGVAGEILLLTSLYIVMPVGRLAWRHALIGGLTATVLWELTRHFLVWYFSNLSIVNLVYGTFAAAIMFLLSLELAALILLIGAQVIAEYERIRP